MLTMPSQRHSPPGNLRDNGMLTSTSGCSTLSSRASSEAYCRSSRPICTPNNVERTVGPLLGTIIIITVRIIIIIIMKFFFILQITMIVL